MSKHLVKMFSNQFFMSSNEFDMFLAFGCSSSNNHLIKSLLNSKEQFPKIFEICDPLKSLVDPKTYLINSVDRKKKKFALLTCIFFFYFFDKLICLHYDLFIIYQCHKHENCRPTIYFISTARIHSKEFAKRAPLPDTPGPGPFRTFNYCASTIQLNFQVSVQICPSIKFLLFQKPMIILK